LPFFDSVLPGQLVVFLVSQGFFVSVGFWFFNVEVGVVLGHPGKRGLPGGGKIWLWGLLFFVATCPAFFYGTFSVLRGLTLPFSQAKKGVLGG